MAAADETRPLLETRIRITERGNHLQTAVRTTESLREQLRRHAILASELRRKEAKKVRGRKWRFWERKNKRTRHQIEQEETENRREESGGQDSGSRNTVSPRDKQLRTSSGDLDPSTDPVNTVSVDNVLREFHQTVDDIVQRAGSNPENLFVKTPSIKVSSTHRRRRLVIIMLSIASVLCVVVVITVLLILHPWT